VDLAEGEDRASLRFDRALALARAGDNARAASEADLLTKNSPLSPDRCFQLAQVYGRISAKSRSEHGVSADYADRAVARLRRAWEAGAFLDPHRRKLLDEDPELEPLRDRPVFRLFLADLAFPADPFAH